MTLRWADRVLDTSTTRGTGNITTAGSPPSGYIGFASIGSIAINDMFYYGVADQSGPAWEVGLGTVVSTSPFVFSRAPTASSNSGSAVNFTSGALNVWLDFSAYAIGRLFGNPDKFYWDSVNQVLNIRPNGGTPGQTLAIKDETPTTGATNVDVYAGDGDDFSTPKISVYDQLGTQTAFWRTAGDLTCPAYMPPTQVSMFGNGGMLYSNADGITWDANNAYWYFTPDVSIGRGGVNILAVGNGTVGDNNGTVQAANVEIKDAGATLIPVDAVQRIWNVADQTLTSGSGVQSPFTASYQTLTIAANATYEFEGLIYLTTGTTTHTTAFAIAVSGSATIASILNDVRLHAGAAATVVTAISEITLTSASSTVLNATGTNATTTIRMRGVIITGGSGTSTITPQINFSANPGGTNLCKAGSFFKLTYIGTNTTNKQGS